MWSAVKELEPTYLLELARDKSKKGREVLIGSIADLFAGSVSALTDRERSLMFAILQQLVRDAEMSVRRTISEQLAEEEMLPRDLAKLLANDEIEVAYPILSKSLVLQDFDLIEVIRQRTLEHQLAVAIREVVSEAVSGALVEVGNDDIVVALLNNHGAQISEKTMGYLVEESKRSDTFREPLLRRKELGADLAKRMYLWVSVALRQYVMENFDVDETTIDDLLEAAALAEVDAAALEGLTPTKSEALAAELAEAGVIKPPLLIQLLQKGEVHLFVVMIKQLTGLREKLIMRVLLEPGGEGLAIICKAIGFQKEEFDSVFAISRKARPGDTKTLKHDRSKALDFYDRMTERAAQLVVRRWRRSVDYLTAIRDLEIGS